MRPSLLPPPRSARGPHPVGMARSLHSNHCRPFVGELSLSCPPPPHSECAFILFSVHSVTVCFTLNHPLCRSLSPTSIKYLSSVAVCFSLAAFLSPVNSSFSRLSPLPARSPCLPRLSLSPAASTAALHLLLLILLLPPPPSLCLPLSSPLIPPRSVFIRLRSLSQFGRPRLIASLPPLCLQP